MVVDFLFFSSFLPLLLDSSSCLDFAPNTLLLFFILDLVSLSSVLFLALFILYMERLCFLEDD